MIYNIIEYSLSLLDEESAFQMLQALAEGLQLQRISTNGTTQYFNNLLDST